MAVDEQTARETRERLREILDQYPPSVAQVLRLDPSLLTKPDYLAPYPTLAAFLAQHPEVAHNPVFFLGGARRPAVQFTDKRGAGGERDRERASSASEFLLGFVTAICTLAWLLAVGHRASALAARDEDSDRRAHEDRRSPDVERGSAGLHAVAGRPALPDLVADRRRRRSARGRARRSIASCGPCRRASCSRPAASVCGSRRTA